MQIAHLTKCTACLLLYSCSLHKPFLFIQGSLSTKNTEPTRCVPLISSNKFDRISKTILILRKSPGCVFLSYFSPWRFCLITSVKALFGLLQQIIVKMEINGPNTKLTDCCHLFECAQSCWKWVAYKTGKIGLERHLEPYTQLHLCFKGSRKEIIKVS